MDRVVTPGGRRAGELRGLSLAELRRRAARVRLVITDCDGVLTDAGVYYTARGAVMRRFSVRDGMGVARLLAAGIDTAILSQEKSGDIRARALKLRLSHLYLGVLDKRRALGNIQRASGLDAGAIAFIGDDVNDLALMGELGRSGLTAAPADAMPGVLAVARYRCPNRGGHGAFRDFAEWILEHRTATKGRT